MKRYLVFGFSLCLIFILSFHAQGQQASQFQLSAQFSPIATSYQPLLADEDTQLSQWNVVVAGSMKPAEDALLHFIYSTDQARSLQGVPLTSNQKFTSGFTQGVAMYKFLDEAGLILYGGIGYKVSQAYFHNILTDKEHVYLTGQGFIGQVNMDLTIMDKLKLNTLVSGTPWYSWRYREGNMTQERIQPGSSWYYQLTIEYMLPHGWGLRTGYAGGSTRVPKFSYGNPENQIPASNSSYSGITGGVVIQF